MEMQKPLRVGIAVLGVADAFYTAATFGDAVAISHFCELLREAA